MANTNGPFGLRPVRGKGGDFQQNRYGILPGTTAIYIGDPVKKDTAGTAKGLSTCTIADATGAVLGPVVSIFDSSGFPVSYYPAGNATGYTCMVADNPDQLFIMREDSDTSTLAQADMGLNVNMVAGTGNTTTGLSRWAIDSSSKATTATHQLRLIEFHQTPDNVFLDDYGVYVVKINNHANSTGTGAVGV